jgi:predicted nucleic acid-binding protein
MIAAIALRHGMTVIAGNMLHFGIVAGLSVENWT